MTTAQLLELLVLVGALGAFWFAIEARYVRKEMFEEVVRGLREDNARLTELLEKTHDAVTNRMREEVQDAASNGATRGVVAGIEIGRKLAPRIPIGATPT